MNEPMEMPNPGSDKALLMGCTCPVMDNNRGLHTPWPGDWWVTEGCPLHDRRTDG